MDHVHDDARQKDANRLTVAVMIAEGQLQRQHVVKRQHVVTTVVVAAERPAVMVSLVVTAMAKTSPTPQRQIREATV